MVTQPLLVSIFIAPEWGEIIRNSELLRFLKAPSVQENGKCPEAADKKSAWHLKISNWPPYNFHTLFFFLSHAFRAALSLSPPQFCHHTFTYRMLLPHLLFCNLLTHLECLHLFQNPWPWPCLFSNPSLIVQIKLTTVPLTCKVWTLKGSFNCKCHLVSSWP